MPAASKGRPGLPGRLPHAGVLSFVRVALSDFTQGGTSLHHTIAHCASGSAPVSGGFSNDAGNSQVRSFDVNSTGDGSEVAWMSDVQAGGVTAIAFCAPTA